MRQNDKIREFLFSTDLFQDLDSDCEFEYYIEHHDKADIIFDRHKGIKSLGILYEGQLSVSNIALDGSELLLNLFYPRDYFGLCNLFSTTPLPSTLKCLCASTVIYIPKKDFIRLMNSDIDMMVKVMEFYNRKIMFLQKKIELLNLSSPKAKVCYYILCNMNLKNEFYITCSKCDLSHQIGIGRASLYRELEEMKELSCVDISDNKIWVKNIDEFKKHIFVAC